MSCFYRRRVQVLVLLAIASGLSWWFTRPDPFGQQPTQSPASLPDASIPSHSSQPVFPNVQISPRSPGLVPLALDSVPNLPANAATAVSTVTKVPAWAVPYGEEPWRKEPETKTSNARLNRENGRVGNMDLGGIVDRVSSAFRQPAQGGEWKAEGEAYQAELVSQGLKLTPLAPLDSDLSNESRRLQDSKTSPSSKPSTDVDATFRTVSIRQGENMLFDSADPARENVSSSWVVRGNTAQILRHSEYGVVEHYAARASGVEVSWYFPQPLSDRGGLEVTVAVDQLSFVGASSSGLHFADAAGTPRLRVGKAVMVDHVGRHTAIASTASPGGITYSVPESLLQSAVFPIAIDPEIGPEFGMDQVVNLRAYEAQMNPAVAWDGTCFLAVWRDHRREESPIIFGTRIGSDGVVMDLNGILISRVLSYQEMPSVAGHNGVFLVAWSDYRSDSGNIFAARVNSSGVVLDPNAFAVTSAPNIQDQPAVARQGSNFLVVWSDYRNDSDFSNADIYGAQIDLNGALLGAGDFAISTNSGSQYAPSVASVGSQALVVWSDLRAGPTPESQDIYGARVDGAGGVLDPNGRLISSTQPAATPLPAPQSQLAPSVAANTQAYCVVWQDERNTPETDIYGAIVSTTGAVLQPSGLAISKAEGLQANPAVASDTSGFLAIWEDRRNGGQDIFGARIGADGTLVDATSLEISLAILNQSLPKLAWDGSRYLAVWDDNRSGLFTDIYAARITSAGALVETNGFLASTAENQQHLPSIGWNGTYYLVAWRDFRQDNAFDLYGTRLTTAGSVLDPWGIKISSRASFNSYPSIGASGSDFLLAWEHQLPASDHNIFGRRVSGATGGVLDADDLPICLAVNDQYRATVQGNANGWLVAWGDNRVDPDYDIYGAVINKNGRIATLANGFPISAAPELQFSVRLAWNGTNFLAVWRDSRNAPSDNPDFANRLCDIYGRLISPVGALIGNQDIPICLLPDFRQLFPSVASDGARFLVAWEDNRDGDFNIYGTTVLGNGMVSPVSGIPICIAGGAQSVASVTWDGGKYLVAWLDSRSGDNDIYARQLSAVGVGQGDESGFIVASGDGSQLLPWVASAGQRRSVMVYQNKSASQIGRINARLINDTGRKPPVFTSSPLVSAVVGSLYSYGVTVSDPDTPIPALGTLRLPAWMTFVDRGNGSGTLAGTPASTDVGVSRVSLRAADETFVAAQSFEVVVSTEVTSLRILSIRRSGGGTEICWESVAGKSYRLESKVSVEGATWSLVSLVAATANSASTCFSDPSLTDPARFYRIVSP